MWGQSAMHAIRTDNKPLMCGRWGACWLQDEACHWECLSDGI